MIRPTASSLPGRRIRRYTTPTLFHVRRVQESSPHARSAAAPTPPSQRTAPHHIPQHHSAPNHIPQTPTAPTPLSTTGPESVPGRKVASVPRPKQTPVTAQFPKMESALCQPCAELAVVPYVTGRSANALCSYCTYQAAWAPIFVCHARRP